MDRAIEPQNTCHKKFLGLTLAVMVKTLTLQAFINEKGKEMELLLAIALGLSAVAVLGQFTDALVRRLTGRIAI